MADFFGVSQGRNSQLGIAAAVAVKQASGRIQRVQVLVAGSAAGAVYDSVSTSGNSAANQVGVIPNAVGSYLIDMPCLSGIVVVPGTGQTVAVSYD